MSEVSLIHRRRLPVSSAAEDDEAVPAIVQKLRQVDIFPKVQEEFVEKTKSGGIISVITLSIFGFLLLSEFIFYFQVRTVSQLSVDDTFRNQLLPLDLNISFPNTQCEYLNLDIADISGRQMNNIEHEITKVPITFDGSLTHNASTRVRKLGTDASANGNGTSTGPTTDTPPQEHRPNDPNYCGSCYGAETPELPCCNTCDDVKRAYRLKFWSIQSYAEIAQCKEEIDTSSFKGCNIFGVVRIPYMSGNFHFAPGRSFGQSHEVHGHHVHEFDLVAIRNFDPTHVVNHLRFGPAIHGIPTPLEDAQSRFSGTGMYKYFIKLVPIIFREEDEVIHSHQYSVTESFQPFFPGEMVIRLPGVFFSYELTPIRVEYTVESAPFLQMFVRILAIVGGLFTVGGFLDKVFEFIQHRIHVASQQLPVGV